MDPITKEYLLLFNALTDAEECLHQLRARLIAVQQQAEELFLTESLPTGACLESRDIGAKAW